MTLTTNNVYSSSNYIVVVSISIRRSFRPATRERTTLKVLIYSYSLFTSDTTHRFKQSILSSYLICWTNHKHALQHSVQCCDITELNWSNCRQSLKKFHTHTHCSCFLQKLPTLLSQVQHHGKSDFILLRLNFLTALY